MPRLTKPQHKHIERTRLVTMKFYDTVAVATVQWWNEGRQEYEVRHMRMSLMRGHQMAGNHSQRLRYI